MGREVSFSEARCPSLSNFWGKFSQILRLYKLSSIGTGTRLILCNFSSPLDPPV
jgi:hypothetical protein